MYRFFPPSAPRTQMEGRMARKQTSDFDGIAFVRMRAKSFFKRMEEKA
jgi:hypothetical protein